MGNKKRNDPLLDFFDNILDSEDEKKILYMIYKNYDVEKILEELINYPQEEDNDDKIWLCNKKKWGWWN